MIFYHSSNNIIVLLNEILNNQEICKYIYYNSEDPLNEPDLSLPATNLLFNKVFPYPFDPKTTENVESQIRVYYPKIKLYHKAIETSLVGFDIVLHKSLWKISGSKLRPYEILHHLTSLLEGRTINQIWKVKFTDFINPSFKGYDGAKYVQYNDFFNGYQIFAEIQTTSS